MIDITEMSDVAPTLKHCPSLLCKTAILAQVLRCLSSVPQSLHKSIVWPVPFNFEMTRIELSRVWTGPSILELSRSTDRVSSDFGAPLHLDGQSTVACCDTYSAEASAVAFRSKKVIIN